MTIKTMTAPIKWNKDNKVTCTYDGLKIEGKAIWYDELGNAYDLMYARASKKYSFYPMPKFNK